MVYSFQDGVKNVISLLSFTISNGITTQSLPSIYITGKPLLYYFPQLKSNPNILRFIQIRQKIYILISIKSIFFVLLALWQSGKYWHLAKQNTSAGFKTMGHALNSLRPHIMSKIIPKIIFLWHCKKRIDEISIRPVIHSKLLLIFW